MSLKDSLKSLIQFVKNSWHYSLANNKKNPRSKSFQFLTCHSWTATSSSLSMYCEPGKITRSKKSCNTCILHHIILKWRYAAFLCIKGYFLPHHRIFLSYYLTKQFGMKFLCTKKHRFTETLVIIYTCMILLAFIKGITIFHLCYSVAGNQIWFQVIPKICTL